MAQLKTTLTFPPELMGRIDAYCRSHYLTRSGFVQMASVKFLDAQDMASDIQEMVYTGQIKTRSELNKVIEKYEKREVKEIDTSMDEEQLNT